MRKQLFVITLIAGFLIGCASTNQAPIDTTNLHALKNLSQEDIISRQPSVSKIRLKAIKETALTLGAQGGLAYRSRQLDKILSKNKYQLDRTFSFNQLLLNHNVLPPVLIESKQSLNLSDPDSIRVADRTYKIVQQARFVTTAPTWRDYIWLSYKKPAVPDATLLPRNGEEREIWEKNVNIGWIQGIQQANDIYSKNLAKLRRDLKGILLYRNLLAQKMVNRPTIAKFNMGITSNNNNTELRINDKTLQITAKPKFNTNAKKWKPALEQ